MFFKNKFVENIAVFLLLSVTFLNSSCMALELTKDERVKLQLVLNISPQNLAIARLKTYLNQKKLF